MQCDFSLSDRRAIICAKYDRVRRRTPVHTTRSLGRTEVQVDDMDEIREITYTQ